MNDIFQWKDYCRVWRDKLVPPPQLSLIANIDPPFFRPIKELLRTPREEFNWALQEENLYHSIYKKLFQE